ncbi:sulfur carrier protein ThiS [Bacillus spongiae]|uniref:Sulfur carrier protein ThiS n=1 Tax=Bacillus spongiae TaxID=2683610 RepID=A0ABU8HKH6_9BACI
MNLRINGESITVPKDIKNVTALLAHYGVEDQIIIVEHNHEIIEKDKHQTTNLQDGDNIEIVHFVGGG